jgi:hypothetical protein
MDQQTSPAYYGSKSEIPARSLKNKFASGNPDSADHVPSIRQHDRFVHLIGQV